MTLRQMNDKLRGHSLLTAEIRASLPQLYATDQLDFEACTAQVKFFTPGSHWTWYATEFDGQDTFFGLVYGFAIEIGYFSLAELETVRGKRGLPVERDLYFEPMSIAEVRLKHSNR